MRFAPPIGWSGRTPTIGPGDPADPLGAADCELLRSEVIAQPVNSLSSFALALIGIWLVVRSRRCEQGRGAALAFGVVTVLAGLGSVDYHGVQTAAAQWTHDGGAALLIAASIGVPVWRLVRRRVAVPGWSALRGVVLAGAAAVALLAYWGGRTGTDLCDPDSLIQLHGLWHLMIGVLAALWAGALWPVEVPTAATETEPSWGEHRFLYRLVRIAARLVKQLDDAAVSVDFEQIARANDARADFHVHHSRHPVFARDDGRVRERAAEIRDDGFGDEKERRPTDVGVRRDENFAGAKLGGLVRRRKDTRAPSDVT